MRKSHNYLKILAIVFNITVFLFWGAFFLEHLISFFDDSGNVPFYYFLIQLFHFIFLISLIIALKWNVTGSILTLLFSLLFFWHAAGKNFYLFFFLSNIGSFIFVYIVLYKRNIFNK